LPRRRQFVTREGFRSKCFVVQEVHGIYYLLYYYRVPTYLGIIYYVLVSAELSRIIVSAAFGSDNNNSIIIIRMYLFVNDNVGNKLIN